MQTETVTKAARNGHHPPNQPDFDHSDRVERCLLGSLLRWNAVIGDVAQVVREQDFRTERLQAIFRAILSMFLDGKPVDTATVYDWLHIHAKPAGITTDDMVALWEAEPTGAHAEYYAEIVRDAAIRRQLAHLGAEIHREAISPSMPAREALEAAERQIYGIGMTGMKSVTYRLEECVGELWDVIDARKEGKPVAGVSTGYEDLDARLGALPNGEFILVAARTTVGKTTLAINLTRNAIRDGAPVLFASLEQSRIELTERLLCCQAEVCSHRLRTGTMSADDMQKIHRAGDALRGLPLHIHDRPCQSMVHIASTARRLVAKHKIRMLVIDYLQLIEPENRRENRQEQVAGISRRLKVLARELQIPVVVLAQVNRVAEQRADGRPKLHDLRESGSLEQDADVVLLLNQPTDREGVIEVDVAKQRNGPRGTVVLAYRKECYRFDNLAWDGRFP